MSEELGVRVAVDGFADFNRAFDAMNKKLDESADNMSGMSGPSASMGRAFDKNEAEANKLKLAMLELASTEEKLANETDDLKKAQLSVRADSLRQQIEQLNQAEERGVAQTSKFKMGLSDLKAGFDLAMGAAKATAAAIKGAFEFAKEGAGILQAQETVKNLGINLEQLRSAAGGTVDDMTLISSTAKLLAGTTGELNTRMAQAAPQLLEVARAAVKLDPTIGDVAFVYESLSNGIKKNQPLLIDNANITVKVGAANEALAKKLGKTVQQLTDEEKSMALLEATLASGANMIDQMGGSLDSATDSYAIIETQIKNTTDLLKAQAAEVAGPTVSAWAQHYQALDQQEKKLFSVGNMFDSARLFITGTSSAIEEMNQRLATLEFMEGYSDAMVTAKDAMMATMQESQALREDTTASADAWDAYTKAVNMSEEAQVAQVVALQEAQKNILATDQALSTYRAGLSGAVGNEMESFKNKESDLIAKGEELRAKITELEQKKYLTEAQKEELASLRDELALNGEQIDENAAQHEEATKRILLSFAEQRLAMDGLTADELLALQELATNWGLMDQATLEAIKSIDSYAASVESGKSGLDEFVEKNKNLANSLLEIPTEVNVVVKVRTEGSVPQWTATDLRSGEYTPQAFQHGGTPTGGNIVVGEHGIEMLTGVPSSARVISSPTTSRMISQSSTTKNYNLTTQSMVRPGGLALEFASMEMGDR